MIRHEIKSQLAKLLATEDLVVENRPVETAQFNVHTRVLTLPQWERASSTVYDLLVGHEVGHALFTPDQDPPKGIPHSFLNIVEDARIEKLMKRKYMGLAKTFFKGYKQLSDEDFFCLEGEDVDKMNLADRANLWFKIGNHIDIPFNNDEEGMWNTFGWVLVRSEESMSNFMTHQQVIHGAAGTFPLRKSQNTGVNIELCSLNRTVLNHQVLSRKELGELGLDFVADHNSVSDEPIIQKKGVRRLPCRHL